MENNPQRQFYDRIRESYRKSKNGNFIPKFMRIYLELEKRRLDEIDRLYYAICNYLYLDIEPGKSIRNSPRAGSETYLVSWKKLAIVLLMCYYIG